jgi:xanthine dehydrogenase accessory factor
MGDKSCVIVLGLGELASAVARRLLLEGHAVAMHAGTPPAVLRRKMAFSDAWDDGLAILEGVEARRIGNDADFLAGLRSSMFIPVVTQSSFEAIVRWPWDVVVDAREPPEAAGRADLETELSIVLGPGAEAGVDCDIVIETGGNDPGAVIRSGGASSASPDNLEHPVAARSAGLFHAESAIGSIVASGDVLGFVGSTSVAAPLSGRLRGLLRSGARVRAGETVAEITAGTSAPVNVIDLAYQLIARSVAFTIDMEQQGRSIDVWNRRTGFRPAS